jgi:colicin import membrane protein
MRKNPRERKAVHRTDGSRPLSKGRFTRPVILSLILHGLLLIFLAINFRSFLPQSNASYPVTIAPLGSPGGGDVPTPPLAPPAPEKIAVPAETPKVDAPKADAPKADAQKSDKVELKKTEQEKVPLPAKDQKQDKGVAKKEGPEGLKKTDTAKKSVPPKDSSYSYKDVQAKIAKMSEEDQARPPEGKSPGGQPGQGPSSGQSGSGTGTGAEVNAYAGLVETKVKGEWVIPENLSKAHGNLEAIIVVIIDRAGKVQKSRFEKKSGNELYDQSAMRAIKKAEPFPPVPIELIDKEIGLIFKP